MIKFTGHASFLIKSKNYQLLIDPWFTGSAFDLGWDLTSKFKLDHDEISMITHIWYSHEHPDHFSIKDLKNIYSLNNKIKIIFQYTDDKRVLNFCKKIGFEVIEVKNFQKYFFDENSYIQIIKCGLIDSFSIIKDQSKIIVNMNDCVPGEDLNKVKKIIENLNIDILFTQFSYADWKGNPQDIIIRQLAVKEKFKQISDQINFFRPKFVCPFASFIFFSHEENFFMNDAIPDIQQVHDYIKNLNTMPVILYPGDQFNYHNKDNSNSIRKYQTDYRNITIINKSKTVPLDVLMDLSAKQILRIKKYNNVIFVFLIFFIGKYLRKGIKPIKFLVKDLNIIFNYNIFQGLKIENSLETVGVGGEDIVKNIDLIITSDVLESILKNDWGIGTTLINGRFFLKNLKFLDHFRTSFSITLVNSHGLTAFNLILNKFKKKFKIADLQFTLLQK
jgi:UDP-MurNAc hydroxylase